MPEMDYCSDTEILMEQAREEDADLVRITFDYILASFVKYLSVHPLYEDQFSELGCIFGSLVRECEFSSIVQFGSDIGLLYTEPHYSQVEATLHGQRWANKNIDRIPTPSAGEIRFTLNHMFPQDAPV